MILSHDTAVVVICLVMGALHAAVAARRGLGWRTGALMGAAALVLCLVGARLYYIAVADLPGAGYFGPLFPQDPYSYAFGGGVLGYLLALWLSARLIRRPLSALGDAFAPLGLMAIAALRLAEALSDFGWGDLVEAAWMQRYPFAIQNMYEEWCAAVFNLEALCALCVLAGILLAGDRLAGRRLATAAAWWAVTQIFCESLRVESIQWGFVRVQQLQSAVIAAWVIALGTLRLPRGQRRRSLPSWAAFAVCAGLVIFLEYAIDKMPWPTWANYAAMAAVLAVMGLSVQRMIRLGVRA